MPITPFPQGTALDEVGTQLGRSIRNICEQFWIHATKDGRRALLANAAVVEDLNLASEFPHGLRFGNASYRYLIGSGHLDAVSELPAPDAVMEAMPLARALSSHPNDIQTAIFCAERNLIIDVKCGAPISKAALLGQYLTGGVQVRADDLVTLLRILPNNNESDLASVAEAAGIPVKMLGRKKPAKSSSKVTANNSEGPLEPFTLPGREDLANFFNEHVIEILQDEERYASLGIGFPGGIILEGPTGCGKTYAVERLIEHLGWPSFHVEASSVASPYIHETSRKVAEVFNQALKAAPSAIVIDEMDAFLAIRDNVAGQHQVEEVAEFLRRIPEARDNRVLVVGMTNNIKAIDSAILRRGRFDHVIHVGPAGKAEVTALIRKLLNGVPNEVSIVDDVAIKLAGRPLSDVSFVVREAGRITARSGKNSIGDDEISKAVELVPSRDPDEPRRIGF